MRTWPDDDQVEIIYTIGMWDPQNEAEGALGQGGTAMNTQIDGGTGLVADTSFLGGSENGMHISATTTANFRFNIRGTALDKATSTMWSIDVLVLQTTLNGSRAVPLDFRDSSGTHVPCRLFVNGDGTLTVELITTGGTYTATTAGAYFPRATTQNLRLVIDFAGAQVKLYAGNVGDVPSTLLLTMATDTNALLIGISVCYMYTLGASFSVGRVRLSRAGRVDSFPSTTNSGQVFFSPDPGWVYDADTVFIAPLSERLGTSNSAIIQDGAAPACVVDGVPPAMDTVLLAGGSYARHWINGATNKLHGGTANTPKVLDPASSRVWTVDGLVTKNNINGSGKLISLANGSLVLRAEVVIGSQDHTDVDGYYHSTGAGSPAFEAIKTGVFPAAVEQHIRVIYDWSANEVRLYIGPVGTVPVLVATTPTDGNAGYNDISEIFFGPCDDMALRWIRCSKVARSDAFPIPGGGGSAVVSLSNLTGSTPGVAFLTATWSETLLDVVTVRDSSRYSFISSSGGALLLSGVYALSASTEWLALGGDFRTGGSYSLLVKPSTAWGATDGGTHGSLTSSFVLPGIIFTGSSVQASAVGPSLLDVSFVKPVVQASPVGTNDALNPANYSLVLSGTLTTLSVLSSATRTTDTVRLTLGSTMSSVPYVLTVSSVHDYLGNPI